MLELDLDFSVEVTGFSISEIDALVEGLRPEEPGDPADDLLPDPAKVPRRCQLGHLWQLGAHRLICGDALDSQIVARLMDGDRARMIFSDPPYNVPIDGHVGGLGKTKHREFAVATGELSSEAFTDFLRQAFRNMAAHSLDGSIHFLCIDWRHMRGVAPIKPDTWRWVNELE